MARPHFLVLTVMVLAAAGPARADAPVASYIFPAGGQRGTTVEVRVGGLNLHRRCSFEMLGPGVSADGTLPETATIWFEGPIIPLPDSQQAEDYPKDHAGRVRIAADAAPGVRHWRTWTSQGATPALPFVVGELPEIVEGEIDGDPVPVPVSPPVTINGRIFPREDVDIWSFEARRGQSVTCEVQAARLGSPLDARLEVRDPEGRRIAENDDALGSDPLLHFTVPGDGTYQVRIQDVNVHGGQSLVYRLTLTTAPFVDGTYPLGGRRGTEPRFELFGAGVPGEAVPIALPEDGQGPFEITHRLSFPCGTTNPFSLAVDDLPEALEVEPNDADRPAVPVAPPAILNGRIDRPGDVDAWAVRLGKNEPYEFNLLAGRLGSPLDGVLTILDAGGKELARADGEGGEQGDPRIPFAAPGEAIYVVRIADRFRTRGGARYAYRLRIDRAPQPDFRLRLATDAAAVHRGGQAKLKVDAERVGGFTGPIALELEGLPPGVAASNTTIAANQGSTEIDLKAEPAAPIRGARLTIRGSARIGDRSATRTAARPAPRGRPAIDSVLLAVTLPTPFKLTAPFDFRWVARGMVRHRRFRIERGSYAGPLEIRLADRQARHLQGVAGPTLIVPPGISEFDFPVTLPPWMETGRTSRSVVRALGVIRDPDGTEHEVSYSSPEADVQIIAVVEPGRLAVEAARSSIAAAPGTTTSVPVHVTRGKGLRGPVQLELVAAPHLRGISAQRVEIAADQSDAVLTIAFAELPEAINLPLVIRATAVEQGDPVIAEAKVAVSREP
jgi:hypothetical protein